MKNKNILIIVFSVVLVLIIVGVVWYKASPESFKGAFYSEEGEEKLSETGTETGPAGESIFPTRQEAPENAVVPEPGAETGDSDIAVPSISIPAAPGIEDRKLRSFDILAVNGKYTPSTIIVDIGDIIHINFTAEDDTYDIVFPDYGLRQTVSKGQTKVIEFQGNIDGQFSFYCENACPKGDMFGTLIVKP
ncbi:cupredoxin domain-containing protein [Candidatus Wolfebacteria bacterium]|nr:cupredoxin domain-containing protein [Candidatus Wolfebacteria bacterium]